MTKKEIIQGVRDSKIVVDCREATKEQVIYLVDRVIEGMEGKDYTNIHWKYVCQSQSNDEFMFADYRYNTPKGAKMITYQEYSDAPEEPFKGSREYDEKLLMDWNDFYDFNDQESQVAYAQQFLNYRYKKSDLLKEKEQLEKRLSEINKQLKQK